MGLPVRFATPDQLRQSGCGLTEWHGDQRLPVAELAKSFGFQTQESFTETLGKFRYGLTSCHSG